MRGVKVPATILSNAVRLLLLAISGKNVLLLDEWPMCAAQPLTPTTHFHPTTHASSDTWAFVSRPSWVQH